MTAIVTGGAGFVASTLISRLLEKGQEVLALDNLCRGSLRHLEQFHGRRGFTFRQASLDQLPEFRAAVTDVPGEPSSIWHLAANSDIPAGVASPEIDLRDTFLTTFNSLIVARELGIKKFYFASSSAIYGDFGVEEIHENIGPLFPISNYGAMKLASEAQISAAVESFLERAVLFRFPNVVGVPATHGVILDFINKLRRDPSRLPVLGDGTQQKAYLHVTDLVDAMIFLSSIDARGVDAFNIGPLDDGITVREIANTVVSQVAPGASVSFGSGNKGWVGDVPRFRYSVERLKRLGWRPALDSRGAVQRAVREIAHQEGAIHG